jgi:hypothetical protein
LESVSALLLLDREKRLWNPIGGKKLESELCAVPPTSAAVKPACVQLAQASASPEDRKRYANLAARWISLAGDLEAIDTQLRSEPAKRKTG